MSRDSIINSEEILIHNDGDFASVVMWNRMLAINIFF